MDTQTPMQSMNASQQGQRFRQIHVLTGPRAGTVEVQPIPEFSFDSFGHNLFDDFLLDDVDLAAVDDIGDVLDDYLSALANGSGSEWSCVGASEEAILSLEEVTGRSRSGEECAVCLQDFGAEESLRAMPCSHVFHQHCIAEWLRRKNICPLCSCRLPDEEDEKRRICLHHAAS